ncbi:hypothetical protein JW905_01735, partial [bacterium]|nr:hypothetical protein [candidate division CSSED10-310 bacterium]
MADNEGTGIEIAYSNASIHFNTVAGNAGSGITATNLLEQVSVDLGGGPVILAQNLRHNPAGGLSACTYGNGVTLAITPDVRNRP